MLSSESLQVAAPLLVLAIAACAVLLLAVAPGAGRTVTGGNAHLAWVTLAALAAAGWLLGCTDLPTTAVFGALVTDPIARGFGVVALGAAAMSVLVSTAYLDEHRLAAGEYFALVLLSTLGMVLVAMAADMVGMFLGIEIMSLGAYVLTGYHRALPHAHEAAIKYFLFGAFASAVILFGVALIYGETGLSLVTGPTFTFAGVRRAFTDGASPLGWIGVAMVLSGLLFKAAAVPMHMWAPDAYEGAPTPVAALMAVGVKTAAFASLCRVTGSCLAGHERGPPTSAVEALEAAALASMVVGNLLALRQHSIKRLLAYSSIAHAGYLLLGVVAMVLRPGGDAGAFLVLYLLAYTAMTVGAFAVTQAVGRPDDQAGTLTLDALRGAGTLRPGLGLAMTVFVVSLAGLPPTGGFVAKAGLFYGAIDAGRIATVAAASLCSVLGVAAYLRLLVALWAPAPRQRPSFASSAWLTAGIWAAAAVTVALGLAPQVGLTACLRLMGRSALAVGAL